MRNRIIARLERKLESCAIALKEVYRKDLHAIYCNLEKEIEIQIAYMEHERG